MMNHSISADFRIVPGEGGARMEGGTGFTACGKTTEKTES